MLDQVCDEQDARERATDERREGNELHLPYWAELWDSSIGVGHWLVRSDLRNRQVLDLGCGMGFAGTVAAAMGHRVILADLESQALLFARLNTLPHAPRSVFRNSTGKPIALPNDLTSSSAPTCCTNDPSGSTWSRSGKRTCPAAASWSWASRGAARGMCLANGSGRADGRSPSLRSQSRRAQADSPVHPQSLMSNILRPKLIGPIPIFKDWLPAPGLADIFR